MEVWLVYFVKVFLTDVFRLSLVKWHAFFHYSVPHFCCWHYTTG